MLWSAHMLCEVCSSIERDAVLSADSRDGAFDMTQDCTACGYKDAMQVDWESLRPSIPQRSTGRLS